MVSGTAQDVVEQQLDARSVLDRARAAQAAIDAAELDKLRAAVDWAAIHSRDTIIGRDDCWHEQELPVGGEGAPTVAEWAIVDFAAALHMSTDSGRRYMADAVELRYRLPLVFACTNAGEVDVWRARRIAAQTAPLPEAVAHEVDRRVARVAQSITFPALKRLIEREVARLLDEEPSTADSLPLFVSIDFANVSSDGVVDQHGALLFPDAVDLDHALSTGAKELAEQGCPLDLAQRRSLALGALARIDVPLVWDDETGTATADLATPATVRSRELVIHTHLTARPDDRIDGAGTAAVEKQRCDIPVEQLMVWTQLPAARITVKPIIDLSQPITSNGYTPSPALAEHIILRDRVCVFPHCNRPARGCDRDHVVPWDPNGPPGQTTSANLASLCRRHHRAKTTGHWSYSQLEPGLFFWRNSRTGEQIITLSGGRTYPLPPT